MWPRPAIDQVGIFPDDKNDEAATITTTMQNIHDNRGSHEAKDARKAIESQSVSMIRTHERSKKRSSIEERSWAKRQFHLQGGKGRGERECGRVTECGGSV